MCIHTDIFLAFQLLLLIMGFASCVMVLLLISFIEQCIVRPVKVVGDVIDCCFGVFLYRSHFFCHQLLFSLGDIFDVWLLIHHGFFLIVLYWLSSTCTMALTDLLSFLYLIVACFCSIDSALVFIFILFNNNYSFSQGET